MAAAIMALFIALAFALVGGAAYLLVACGDHKVVWMIAALTAALVALAIAERRPARKGQTEEPRIDRERAL